MHVHSYKYYLQVLDKKPKKSYLQKAVFLSLAAILVVAGAVSAFSFWQYKKESPLRAEVQYLETVMPMFNASRTSLFEIIANFQVAGAKTKAIDALKESTPTAAGYFVNLDDIDRSIAQIQSTQKNFLETKNQLSKLSTPPKFDKVKKQLLSYYNISASTLEGLLERQKFQKEILLATGTSFYLPVLSDETLWQSKNAQNITAYYTDKKKEAAAALSQLSTLAPPDDFKSYYDSENTYLALLVTVSDDITKTLSEKDDTQKDSVPQIEKAYQKLSVAKVTNEKLSQKLLEERTKIFDKKNNIEKFAAVSIEQNSLASQLSDLYASQPQPKTYQIPEALVKWQQQFSNTNFLEGLQNLPRIW